MWTSLQKMFSQKLFSIQSQRLISHYKFLVTNFAIIYSAGWFQKTSNMEHMNLSGKTTLDVWRVCSFQTNLAFKKVYSTWIPVVRENFDKCRNGLSREGGLCRRFFSRLFSLYRNNHASPYLPQEATVKSKICLLKQVVS